MAEVDAVSFWEFLAARDGWIRANSVTEAQAPSPEEHDAMLAKWGVG